MTERRARTRRLIERGGLVAKSGIEETIARHRSDTAAILLGALLELSEAVRAGGNEAEVRERLMAWQARGRAALRAGASDTDRPVTASGEAE